METLLDRHLATFDLWLQAQFMYLSASSRSHFLAVITLLDQLDPKQYDWECFSLLLEGQPSSAGPITFFVLFNGTNSNIEHSRMMSKFLMDRNRAGSLWVNLQTYVNLATQLLNFLRANK
jgi:hypothetical protein